MAMVVPSATADQQFSPPRHCAGEEPTYANPLGGHWPLTKVQEGPADALSNFRRLNLASTYDFTYKPSETAVILHSFASRRLDHKMAATELPSTSSVKGWRNTVRYGVARVCAKWFSFWNCRVISAAASRT